MQTVWNRINTALLVLVLLLVAGALVKGVYGGPLDPPAPPGSTLPQVEPRTPISQPAPGGLPIVISQPGSYFLTQNIMGEAGKDGIQITTSAVTLDLNGFSVIGVPGSLKGIHVTCGSTCYLIEIHGGNVAAWGGDGIDMGLANTGEVTRVEVAGNSGDGIAAPGDSTIVSDCIVAGNGGDGVDAGSHYVVVRKSIIGSNGGGGVVGGSLVVEDNYIAFNGGHGISGSGPSHIVRNNAILNGQDGILVTAGSLITDNNAAGNHAKGIEVLGSPNLVARNTAGDNGFPNYLNYVIAPNNDVGPIGWAATSASAWANISGYSY